MAKSNAIYDIDGDEVSFQGFGKVTGNDTWTNNGNTYTSGASPEQRPTQRQRHQQAERQPLHNRQRQLLIGALTWHNSELNRWRRHRQHTKEI